MRKLKERPYALIFPKGEGRTEQAHAGEADINTIMRRAQRGEMSDYINKHAPHYGVATPLQFFDAQVIIATGNSMFEDLPSGLRSRFNHNPTEFLEFVQDPKNSDELIKLKLKKPPPPPLSTVKDQKPQQSDKEASSTPQPNKNEQASKTEQSEV